MNRPPQKSPMDGSMFFIPTHELMPAQVGTPHQRLMDAISAIECPTRGRKVLAAVGDFTEEKNAEVWRLRDEVMMLKAKISAMETLGR